MSAPRVAGGPRPVPPGRPTPRAVPVLLALAGVLSLLVAAGSGLAIRTINHVEGTITKIPVGPSCRSQGCLRDVTPECLRDACTFLVLGSDSRKGLPPSEQVSLGTTRRTPGQRADTIMLVQVDPQRNRTVVLSIPRDLRVPIPGHGEGKINTAFDYGPNVMVRTVEQLTGLPVNHYVEVNFLGFQRLVDAIGGVPICIDQPMVDRLANLYLPRRGCYDLDGRQALAFVRARHIEGDLIPDFSRIARQQQFMRALIGKVLSIGSVLKLPDLIRALQQNLVLDRNLNLYALQDLTKKLADVGQRGVYFRIVPSVPVQIDGVDYLRLVQPEASRLFRRIRDGKSLGKLGLTAPATRISPANVTVEVLDASSGGHAREVADFLTRAGFVVLGVEPAPPGLTTSSIRYRPASADEKEVVASYLTLFPVVLDPRHARGLTVLVVVGPDFPGIEGT